MNKQTISMLDVVGATPEEIEEYVGDFVPNYRDREEIKQRELDAYRSDDEHIRRARDVIHETYYGPKQELYRKYVQQWFFDGPPKVVQWLIVALDWTAKVQARLRRKKRTS